MNTKQKHKEYIDVIKKMLRVSRLQADEVITDKDQYTAHKLIEEFNDYNGWSNRETWAVALHIDNNKWSHVYKNNLVSIVEHDIETQNEARLDKANWTDQQYMRFTLADQIKDWIEELFEDYHEAIRNREGPKEKTRDVGLMIQDVGSLWRVDWDEIADNYLEE